MALVQAPKHPGGLEEEGGKILEAAKSIDTQPIKAKLARFAAAHRAFVAANAEAMKAEERHGAALTVVAELDVDQDAHVDALAEAMAGDGFGRQNPFKAFGAAAPSTVKVLGYGEEAKVVRRLAVRVKKHKDASARTKTAATALDKIAAAVEKALAPVPALAKARSAAITRRDPLALAWRTAFAALKRGAKSAEDDGARGLVTALFDRPAHAKPAKSAKPARGAAPAGAAPAGAAPGTPP